MAKPKIHLQTNQLIANLDRITHPTHIGDTTALHLLMKQPIQTYEDSSRLPRLKKFRFQLLHRWLVNSFMPCKVADIGGGKGLAAYLLRQSGWDVTVIDPVMQPLPVKYKDVATQTRLKIGARETVPLIQLAFTVDLAQGFDLLVAMHAHGCNVQIIDAAEKYGCGFAIFPCCIINEPFVPSPGVHWLESLAEYAIAKGLLVKTVRLNFTGQNIGLYTPGRCELVSE